MCADHQVSAHRVLVLLELSTTSPKWYALPFCASVMRLQLWEAFSWLGSPVLAATLSITTIDNWRNTNATVDYAEPLASEP